MARVARPHGRLALVACAALALTLSACSGAGENPTSAPPAASAPPSPSVTPSPSPTPTIRAEVGTGWELTWHDEFDGTAVDASKWSIDNDCGGGGTGSLACATNREDNVAVSGGNLVIRALKEEHTGSGVPFGWDPQGLPKTATLPYTSGQLRTLGKGDFTYGRIEVRAKLPGGQGIWPAIWMMPSQSVYGSWPQSGEIDITEAINLGTMGSKVVYGTLHYGGPPAEHASSGAGFDMTDDDPRGSFHTYAIEWSAHEIRWYVDDVQYATQRSTGWYTQVEGPDGALMALTHGEPFDQAFYLVLDVAVGGDYPGPPDATTVLPVQMDVDYVRVFTCAADPESLDSCATIGPDAQIVPGNSP